MLLFVSALEPSSNLHFRYLYKELKKHNKNLRLCGVFDESLCEDSTPLYVPSEFSIMGFLDVLNKINFFYKANKKLAKLALSASKVLLMDSSSFNIPLAKRIKKAAPDIEIVYYILPQVWAWKPWRAKVIEENCDKLAAILPFESSYYQSKAHFVGHPLLDEISKFKNFENKITKSLNTETFNKQPLDNTTSNLQSIAFMPGSRNSEIKNLFPIFRVLRDRLSTMEKLRFILVVPSHLKDCNLSDIYGDISGFEISFDTHRSLYNSKFAFICSGTATLESALIGTPFVLCYKAKKIDEFIVRMFLNIKYIGLANILYSKINKNSNFHLELLQDDVNVEKMLESYLSFDYSNFISKSIAIRKYLGHGSAKNVASLLKA